MRIGPGTRFPRCRGLALAAVLTAALGLGACEDGGSPPPDPSIRGEVVDQVGQPVADAVIGLEYDLPGAPAKPQTLIQFQLPAGGRVRVMVRDQCRHDTLAVVFDGDMGAGLHDVMWDGRDGEGRYLNSGLYEYLIDSESMKLSNVFMMGSPPYPADAVPADYRPLAVTGADGRFEIAQDCLAFGFEMTLTDELGQPVGTYVVPREVRLRAVSDGHQPGVTGKVAVDPERGASVRILTGPPR